MPGAPTSGPRSVLTRTGKKQSAAAITIFDQGLNVPNHAFVIGANAITGMAFAAIRYGMSAFPSGRQRASTSAATIAPRAAEHEAAERLLERDPGGRRERVAVLPERAAGRPRGAAGGSSSPRARRGRPTASRRSRSRRRAPPEARRARPPTRAAEPAAVPRRRDRAHSGSLRLDGVELLPDLGDELEEPRLLARPDAARLRQVDRRRRLRCGRAAATSRRRASRGRPPRRSSA